MFDTCSFLMGLQMDLEMAGPMEDDGHGMRDKSENISPQFMVFV